MARRTRKVIKKRNHKSRKGGSIVQANIPNYAVNNYQNDPNYMQIASRNVQLGGTKKNNKTKRAKKTNRTNRTHHKKYGGSDPLTSFFSPSYSTGIINANAVQIDPAAYVQPVGNYSELNPKMA